MMPATVHREGETRVAHGCLEHDSTWEHDGTCEENGHLPEWLVFCPRCKPRSVVDERADSEAVCDLCEDCARCQRPDHRLQQPLHMTCACQPGEGSSA